MGNFAVNRPVSVLMLTMVLIFFGAGSYLGLPQDLFPEVSQPGLTVRTEYEGATSSEIEETVTRELEEKLGSVKNLESMHSVSGDDKSEIFLTFGWGTDMDLAAMDVRAKLDLVGESLPDDAEDPVVLRASSSAGAVAVLNIAPNPNSPKPVLADDLRTEVERVVRPRLERINGVAAVGVVGGKEYEVQVKVIPAKLSAHKLSVIDVSDALERENLSQRGGKLKEENTRYLIRTVGTFAVKDLGELIVSKPGARVVRLKEVALLSGRESEKEPESFARLSKSGEAQPCVEVSVLKKTGGNSVSISEAVRLRRWEVLYDLAARVAQPPAGRELLPELAAVPTGTAFSPRLKPLADFIESNAPMRIEIGYDEAVFISESLEMVKSNGLQGLILASIILLVFLRRIQSTMVVVVSMPVAVVATFSLFYAGGISINIFSMAGLTLAVGMVVDNAIVVTESIFNHLQHERRVKKAIIDAVTEIGPAVWASTLTTVAVFLPIVFVPGIAGQIFRDLSWVITYTLVFSILFAFTLIPMLTLKMMGIEFALFDLINKGVDTLLWPLTQLGNGFVRLYRVVIKIFIFGLPARLVLVTIMLALFVLVLTITPPTEFFPETKVESFRLTARTQVGQSLESVEKAAGKIESSFSAMQSVKSFNISVTPQEISLIATFDKSAVMAGRIVPLRAIVPIVERLEADTELSDQILDFKVESLNPMKSLLGTGGGDIILKVRGPDLEVLREIVAGGDGILKKLTANKKSLGIANIGKISNSGVPEWLLRPRRNEAADKGLSLKDIADQEEALVAGLASTEIEIDDNTYDIVVSSGAKPASKKELMNLDLATSTGRIVKLSEVVRLEESEGPTAIYREDRTRTLYVPIFVDKRNATLGTVMAALKKRGGILDEIENRYRKQGYSIALGGASEQMNKSLGYMMYAFLAAIILVYMVMASQFESLIHPFTIMFSVPLSLIGAIVGLRISGDALSLTAVIGIIMLAGIVVNNAIILIDYINILRARGMVRNDAIEEAGVARSRPIFMTTLTTVLGMGPLALGLGTGAELYKPLAVVVVSGLSLSTLLTLVFIPTVYCLVDDISDAVGFVGFKLSVMFSRKV